AARAAARAACAPAGARVAPGGSAAPPPLGAQVVHHDLVEGPAEVPRHRLADVAEADESDPPHALAHGPPRRALVAAPHGIIPPRPADPPQPPAQGAPLSPVVLRASLSPSLPPPPRL